MLVSNFGGSSSALLSLDGGQLAGRLKLDVLIPVAGHKRCLDTQNGYGVRSNCLGKIHGTTLHIISYISQPTMSMCRKPLVIDHAERCYSVMAPQAHMGHVMHEFAYPVQRLGLWRNNGTCAFGNLGHSPASQLETAAFLNAPGQSCWKVSHHSMPHAQSLLLPPLLALGIDA